MTRRIAAAAAALCLAVAGTADAATACLAKLAEMPVTMSGLTPTVPLTINGQSARFILDTGDFFTMVTDAAAAKFGMPTRDLPFGFNAVGFGGGEIKARLGRAKTFSFAGVDIPNRDTIVGGRLSGYDGLFGQELMQSFDVELDFANGVMRFFKANDCGDAVLAYWAKDLGQVHAVDIAVTTLNKDRITSAAYVDGKLVHVLFDTGAGASWISRQAAARAGVKINDAQVKPAGLSRGLGTGDVETYIAPFASFRLGDEEIQNAQLRISDARVRGDHDMLIGADFFLSHRVLISNSQHKMYFTYNGGPVFDLRVNTDRTQAAPQLASGAEPTTAEAFARRAAAAASRRDYPAALADLDRAVALEPKNVSLLYARSRARFGAGRRDLAIADLDTALTIEPTNSLILVQRAESYVNTGRPDKGRADLDAAAASPPADPATTLRIAALYDRFGELDREISLYEGWIAANPKDAGALLAHAQLCRARGIGGKDLARGAVDCAEALKMGDHTPNALIGRGLIRLRQGQLDAAIVDEDDAIRLQPNSPWALYARGLAKLKKGQKAAGEADLNSAIAMAPNIAQAAAQNGLPRPS